MENNRPANSFSMRTKLVMALVSMTVIPLVITTLMTWNINEQAMALSVSESNHQLAVNISGEVDQMFSEKIRILKIAALSPEMRSMDGSRQGALLKDIVAQYPELQLAVVSDANAKQIARWDGKPADEKINYKDREYFKAVMQTGNTAISGVLLAKSTGRLGIVVAEPIKDSAQNILGVVIISIELQKLIDRIAHIRIGKTGYAFIVNSEGKIIIHPDSKQAADSTDVAGLAPVKAVIAGKSGWTDYEFQGRRKLAGYSFAPLTKFGVIVQQPVEEAMANVIKVRNANILIMFGALAISVLIAFYLARRFFAPIAQLTGAVMEVAEGNYSTQVTSPSNDEIGSLATAFNHMTTQLKNRDAALLESKEKYRSLINNLPVGVYRSSGQYDASFIEANPAIARIFGYDSFEEFMQVPAMNLYRHPKERQLFLDELVNKGAIQNFEQLMRKRDGTPIWISRNATVCYGKDGEIAWIDGVAEDITTRKQAEETVQRFNEELEQRVIDRTRELETVNSELRMLTTQLEAAYGELKSTQSQMLQQEKMASIGQLAAGVAHEINNPMGFIISNLNSLQKYSNKIVDYLETVSTSLEKVVNERCSELNELHEQLTTLRKTIKLDYVIKDLGCLIQESLDGADRVKKIVQDLKSFSRIDDVSMQLGDINSGLESTVNIVWNEIKYKATLKKNLGEIPKTKCSMGQLNQVFMNILVNAAQSIETLGEISIETRNDCDKIYVLISDTGSGIPSDKIGRIFEPFYTTKDVGAGTGLGLSIAYDIIKKHDGEIWVESEVGRGTTFTIAIPIVKE